MLIKKATLCFLITDQTILLAYKKRGFGINFWNGVGGKVEGGETPRQAAIRETEEEISVTPRSLKKLAVIDFYIPKTAEAAGWIQRVFVYLSFHWTGEPVESEEMKPKWFKFTDIPYQKMWPDDIYWLPKVLAGQKLTGQFIFDENFKISSYFLKEIS